MSAATTSDITTSDTNTMPPEDETIWTRLPGLFRRWEFEDVVEVGHAYKFEPAGASDDGTPLIAIYVRDTKAEG